MPDCTDQWREPLVQLNDLTHLYSGLPDEFSQVGLRDLALKGDQLVAKWGLYPTLRRIQEGNARVCTASAI